MSITVISPYHGGSHQAWAEGYREHSRFTIDVIALPARFWKWRMHGGAVTLSRRFLEDNIRTDLLLVSDMLDLTTFQALTRKYTSNIPSVLYMHENQLTYPLPRDGSTGPMRRQLGERDQHYAFINYASMMSADHILFNSRFHLDSFFKALPRFLKHFPEYNELGSVNGLRQKSEILAVGIDLQRLDRGKDQFSKHDDTQEPPLLLWNQRWEYDKNPDDFFSALFVLADEGIPFRLALCGQQYGKHPPAFGSAMQRLADHIVHSGYASPDRYAELLWEADVTVSTAHHEFFGISVLEAIYAHTFPILPSRLSYPELLPQSHHRHCLYQGQDNLEHRLRWALTHRDAIRILAGELATAVAVYDWSWLAPKYDRLLAGYAGLVI
jgi:glycosyltransferase involved in cell wall biosynthesis